MRSKTYLLAFVLVATLRPSYGEAPRFFREQAFTSASFAEAVNHFIRLGEKSAIDELTNLRVEESKDNTNPFSVNARIGIVCRVLFEPRNDEPIRPPAYGWLIGLGNLGLPSGYRPSSWTNVSKHWPLFPVARSGSTYFVLREGYSYQGPVQERETPKDYITYCALHGRFRTSLLKVPTRAEALGDAAALRHSKAWKSILWKDSGVGYSVDQSEEDAWSFIQKQAASVPLQ